MIRRIIAELARLGRRREVEGEIVDELKDYFDRAVEERVSAGVPHDEAVRQTHAEFGNVTVARETAARGGWSGRTASFFHDLGQDVRFATRQYARAPFLTLTMLTILALGIGVNAGLFGVVRSFITSPVPGLPRNERLMRLHGTAIMPDFAAPVSRAVTYSEFEAYRGHRDVFERVAGYDQLINVGIDPGAGHDVIAATVWLVTSDFFATLGVRPAAGPGLPTDPSADRSGPMVAVLGNMIWRNVFGAAPDVVGRTIHVNGVTVTVVGVAPPGFRGATAFTGERAIWMPFGSRWQLEPADQPKRFEERRLELIGTLAPGVSRDAAKPVVHAIGSQYGADLKRARNPSTEIGPLRANSLRLSMKSGIVGDASVMAIATLLVLLITCTNSSSLLVGRALARRREIAVRLSLGASRRRVLRQLLTESALLSLAAGLLGLLLVFIAIRVAASRTTDFELAVDYSTVAFTLLFALGTSFLFGLTPALHASRSSVADALKDSAAGAGRQSRLQRVFIIAQMAFTQPLLVGLAVIVGFTIQAARARPEFAAAPHVATIRLTARADHQGIAPFIERVRSIPGVQGVALVGSAGNGRVVVHSGDERPGAARDQRPITINGRAVSPGYFAMMDVPLVRGRDFEAADNGAAVTPIIIGDDFARQLWGDADPIGRRLDVVGRNGARPVFMPSPSMASDVTGYVVVGVIAAAQAGASDTGEGYRVYSAAAWGRGVVPRLYVRTAGQAADAFPLLLDAARAAMPGASLPSLSTRAIEQADERAGLAQVTTGAAVGGLLMLLLASIGLYAVVAVGVTQRTREIGLRMALGAQRAVVVRSFLMGGLRLCVIGMAIGLPLSMLVLKLILMSQQEISTNPVMIGTIVAGVVLGVASLASFLPARRAAQVNPIIALRAD